MVDKKQNRPIVSKFLKRAQEKQSESSSQLCTITLSKPQEYSFRAAARKMGHFLGREKHLKLKSTQKIQH